ncbi:MAG TPA: class I SAM-dependent methyltransferase [Candidatus Saccharimonadales bacterium]|nr:class I SAM-dependent methyltransferase [Candidatus Saccharimonadales bacterium]
MQLLTTPNWQDYELIDSGKGQRLERFGQYTLVRPDPQCIWQQTLDESQWQKADAIFQRKTEDKGTWNVKMHNNASLPKKWLMHYNNLSFWIKLTPFKHTGIFPEQAMQWDFLSNVIASEEKQSRQPNILNLFAYTGIASLAAASAGAKVTHVDASKPAVAWGRENQEALKLTDKPIRWIVDDVMKFCQREVKRGVKYDGILMDPPIYGHGPEGETWSFTKDFPSLLRICKQLLSDKPLFIIVNAYAISASALMLQNVMQDFFGDLKGTIDCGELTLQESHGKRLLSTGIFGRWSADL